MYIIKAFRIPVYWSEEGWTTIDKAERYPNTVLASKACSTAYTRSIPCHVLIDVRKIK